MNRLLSLTALAASLFSCAPAYAGSEATLADARLACQEHGFYSDDQGNSYQYIGSTDDFFLRKCSMFVSLDSERKAEAAARGNADHLMRQKKAVTEALRILTGGDQ